MKFSLIVYSSPLPPASSRPPRASTTALRFAQTLLEQGHELYRVFFYGDGVYNGALPTEDQAVGELEPGAQWSLLALQHQVDLVLCVTAAEQRGITAARAGFQLSGLGQLVDAVVNSDRCLTFR